MDRRLAAPDEQAEPSLVSVIMIFLNAERFIEEAIESVFVQTWPHWELLLVDDGSTDRSTTIARGYASLYPERVRYLEHPGHANRGTGPSRNLGIAHARGTYVTFLDADDVYLRDRLAKHAAVLDSQPVVDMVQSTMIIWYSWIGNGEEDHAQPSMGHSGVVITPPTMLGVYLNTRCSPGTCSVTARSAAVADVGGFEDAFTGFCEDRVFLSKMYATKNIFVIDECLARYRRRPDALTARAAEALLHRSSAREAYLLRLKFFLQSRSIDEPSFHAAIAHQLRVEGEQKQSTSTDGPALNRMLKGAVKRLARLVLPNSVLVRRRNRDRARFWRGVRAELDQLRREYEAAGDGRHHPEEDGMYMQVERRLRAPEAQRADTSAHGMRII